MKAKRILSLVCAAAAACTLYTPAAARSDTAGLPREDPVLYVMEQGLFLGDGEGRFLPDAPLTRAQAVTVLARLAHVSGRDSTHFSDVPEAAYYRKALGWAADNHLITGVTDTRFAPDQPMTHEELAVLFCQYLRWLGRGDTWAASGQGTMTRAQAAADFAALDQRLLQRDTSIRTHTASDGVTLTGKLDLPAGTEPVPRLVLFVNGSGPNTYDNRRQSGELEFCYFDLFAEQLGARGAAFFRWNTRGVSVGQEPPMFDRIDEAVYQTYLPSTSVSDIGEWIADLRREPRLKDAEIWLLGWSEGTILAPLAARAYPDEISGLLLAGYCNDRMDEIFNWQQSGASSMIFYRQYFDADGDGRISPAEYAADPYGVVASVLGGTAFAEIDLDQDGYLTANDFGLLLAPGREAFYDAVARGDDQWLAENYSVRLTSGWFRAHQQLQPNRVTLPTLDLPIFIFHGTGDANCDVAGVRAIAQTFADLGRENLTVHIYEGYDHNLFYDLYPLYGTMSQAFEDLFQTLALS